MSINNSVSVNTVSRFQKRFPRVSHSETFPPSICVEPPPVCDVVERNGKQRTLDIPRTYAYTVGPCNGGGGMEKMSGFGKVFLFLGHMEQIDI